MNKVVTQHYPAARLPKDLRGDIPTDAMVRIVVSQEDRTDLGLDELRKYLFSGANSDIDTRESVDRIRRLRDEWDE